MRARLLAGVLSGLTILAGCSSPIDRLGGDAAPAGSPRGTATLSQPSASSAPVPGATEPSASTTDGSRTGTPVARSATPGAPTPGTPRAGVQASDIRETDWRNAVISNLGFCGAPGETVTFRDGSNGYDIPCTMLPGGAQPVYAEFVAEEPANAPSTEDALVLIELGSPDAARQQALVPVQLSDDGRGRYAWPIIKGDRSSSTGAQAMTFLSYRVVGQSVEATVRTLDGSTETRRWRKADGSGNWERY
ncbi:hypothetical protein [Micromonospora sp. NPDC093244]|uniref:hypothetical protein n=1 Tax=Micromonospora sp. NPDC093244 TaxID=3155071 RepID=UPI003429E864